METTYKILGADGQEYGPVTLPQLRTWISEGRVMNDTQVSRSDQAGWQPAARFPELDTGTAAPRPAMAADARSTPVRRNIVEADAALTKQLTSGSSWFYWIAGLSLINSVIGMFSDSGGGFVVGLGVTQFIDGMARGMESGLGKTVALVLDVLVAGVFILFGVFAGKRHAWAFIVGMILYALDGVIFVAFQLWLSAGFHAFALFCIFSGFTAQRKLAALERSPMP